MPDRAYVIVYRVDDEEAGAYMYFPIKRDDSPNFAGMPQFFGGAKNPNETDREAAKREMLEESNDQITLGKGSWKKIHTAVVTGDTYNFYISDDFSGSHFLGPLKNPEMQSIEKFYAQGGEEDDVEDLLTRLGIQASMSFVQSETYTAFSKAIEWLEQNIGK